MASAFCRGISGGRIKRRYLFPDISIVNKTLSLTALDYREYLKTHTYAVT